MSLGPGEGKALGQQAVRGAMKETDFTLCEGAPGDRGEGSPGSVPPPVTTSVPPRQGDAGP